MPRYTLFLLFTLCLAGCGGMREIRPIEVADWITPDGVLYINAVVPGVPSIPGQGEIGQARGSERVHNFGFLWILPQPSSFVKGKR